MEQYATDKRVNIPYQLRSTTGTPIKFRACEKNSTLLSMSDNYVYCTMLFELILSLLLQSNDMQNKLWCEAQQTPAPAATYRMILTC